MPAPNGVLSIRSDIKTSHSCEMENINTAAAMERSNNQASVAQAAKALMMDQLQKPSNDSGSQLHPDRQTKAIVLRDEHPDKTALIGTKLNSA